MAQKPRILYDLLHFASTSRSKSMVTLAAVSFAICHLVLISAGSSSGGMANSDTEIPRQLIYFVAELCRFVLPLGFLIAGFATRSSIARIRTRKT